MENNYKKNDVESKGLASFFFFYFKIRRIFYEACIINFDTVCVELKFSDGTMIAIDTIAVENEVADNMYQRSELDWLSYNAPLEYADLILNGDPEKYLKTVTVNKPFEN